MTARTRSWLTIIDAAYRIDLGDTAWLDGVAEALRPRLDRGLGMYAYFYRAPSPDRFAPEPLAFYGCPDEVKAFAGRALADTTPEVVRDALLAHAFGTASDALGPARLRKRLPPVAPPFGIADSIAVNAVDPAGNGCIVIGPVSRMLTLARSERSAWERVTAHLSAGHRLRRGLRDTSFDAADAVVTPSGRIEHATGDAALAVGRAALQRAAAKLDRARRRRTDPSEALDLWTALVAGRWSVVDRFDTDGRRFFVAWRNDPAIPPLRSLAERELQVVSYAALGHSNKLIGYSLGLGTSTVATHLASAQTKLGVRNRVELVEVVRALRWSKQRTKAVGDRVAAFAVSTRLPVLDALSPSERAITERVLRGLSDREIAKERGTSPRTVANQLRQIYERLGVASRAELVAMLYGNT